jgi:hypothetical protein
MNCCRLAKFITTDLQVVPPPLSVYHKLYLRLILAAVLFMFDQAHTVKATFLAQKCTLEGKSMSRR